MFWHVRGNEFKRITGDEACDRLRARMQDGPPPGLLAYRDGSAVGWCSVQPRESYDRLLHSPTLHPENPGEEGVWAVPCFFVHRTARRSGVTRALLDGAVDYAKRQGAAAIEGYPKDTPHRKLQASELYPGWVGLFQDAGFHEVTRRSPTRPIMRKTL